MHSPRSRGDASAGRCNVRSRTYTSARYPLSLQGVVGERSRYGYLARGNTARRCGYRQCPV